MTITVAAVYVFEVGAVLVKETAVPEFTVGIPLVLWKLPMLGPPLKLAVVKFKDSASPTQSQLGTTRVGAQLGAVFFFWLIDIIMTSTQLHHSGHPCRSPLIVEKAA